MVVCGGWNELGDRVSGNCGCYGYRCTCISDERES